MDNSYVSDKAVFTKACVGWDLAHWPSLLTLLHSECGGWVTVRNCLEMFHDMVSTETEGNG